MTHYLTKLEQTCFACPSQWNGETIDGDYVYCRYRWGVLTMDIAPSEEAWRKGFTEGKSYQVYCESHGDSFDGCMDEIDMMEYLDISIRVP